MKFLKVFFKNFGIAILNIYIFFIILFFILPILGLTSKC
jgi:hypothetical protein